MAKSLVYLKVFDDFKKNFELNLKLCYFLGDEYTTLMTQCKEGSQREGLMLDSNEELYKWFTGQVMRNLHVVFTMNPSSEGLKDRAATSPALFNRCVLNWFGDWSDTALFQVSISKLVVKVEINLLNNC